MQLVLPIKPDTSEVILAITGGVEPETTHPESVFLYTLNPGEEPTWEVKTMEEFAPVEGLLHWRQRPFMVAVRRDEEPILDAARKAQEADEEGAKDAASSDND